MRMKYLTELNTERKQQISQTRSNYYEPENQKTPAGVNSRRQSEV